MSIPWYLIVLPVLGAIGFWCAGFVACHEFCVQRRIEEIYHRGYAQGVEHGREMERLHV